MKQETAKNILVIGGTGVMGAYLVPELLRMGYCVDAVSRSSLDSGNPNLKYIQANCLDLRTLQKVLKKKYDAIIDFMTYQTFQFAERFELLLSSTAHYLFLSSYRVYSDVEIPTLETSPRLLDIVQDNEFLETDDYSLAKARQENILRSSKFNNWTILRPAIIYSYKRFQLTTLEAPQILRRAAEGKKVFVPADAMNVQASMTWAGDVAKMISRIVLNPEAYQEAFTIASAEHHTWQEVAEYYRELIGLDYEVIDLDTYLGFFGNTKTAKFQLKYDRCQQRIMDNNKLLRVTELNQSDFMSLRDGLKQELSKIPPDKNWGDSLVYDKMEHYAKERLV